MKFLQSKAVRTSLGKGADYACVIGEVTHAGTCMIDKAIHVPVEPPSPVILSRAFRRRISDDVIVVNADCAAFQPRTARCGCKALLPTI
jgi:hypothetical protein